MADPAIRGVLGRPFGQQAAFFRGKLGRLLPTQTWRDVQRAEHDHGFMVAGAQSADLLADLAAAVDRSVSEGQGLDAFRRDFREIVNRHGWPYRGEENWRTRTIYRTNIATSYSAGRLAQLRAGNFEFWMYKHGGSLDPRPQHLAWDGLVLPANHPFWTTHFPPNGWNCSCRVVGLRDPDHARRLGGDPAKKLPEDWQSIDLKTGAPLGIGAGWDYQPGATVSETVNAMAAKTVQWEYSLAKAYMQNVPEGVRDSLATAYRNLPSVADDARRYAQRVLANPADQVIEPYRTLGLLTGDQAETITRALGRDVEGFDFAIGRDAPLHIRDSHGSSVTELARGQRAVSAADYAKLPAILSAPDAIVSASFSRVGHPIVRIVKQIDGEKFTAAFELRAGRRTLALQSLWIGKP